jgi:hypothetical protein
MSDDPTTGSNVENDPADWVTGDERMTGAQASYLKTLSQEAGEPFDENLSKADASRRIEELQAKTGRGTSAGQRRAGRGRDRPARVRCCSMTRSSVSSSAVRRNSAAVASRSDTAIASSCPARPYSATAWCERRFVRTVRPSRRRTNAARDAGS